MFKLGLIGIVDWFHLPSTPTSHADMCTKFPLEHKFKLRILYCDKAAKKVYLTGKSSFLDLEMPSFGDLKIGSQTDDVAITRFRMCYLIKEI
eukprot:Pgem_evm2s554